MSCASDAAGTLQDCMHPLTSRSSVAYPLHRFAACSHKGCIFQSIGTGTGQAALPTSLSATL